MGFNSGFKGLKERLETCFIVQASGHDTDVKLFITMRIYGLRHKRS